MIRTESEINPQNSETQKGSGRNMSPCHGFAGYEFLSIATGDDITLGKIDNCLEVATEIDCCLQCLLCTVGGIRWLLPALLYRW